ncbi:helix-turn-helix domain-containing protein [Phaeobacter porticola]|uniref:Uncharacterized protein n=1 Tax=Phaeobacter porticola TaxID=1844006 RepID=A0A1L3I0I6_9RHOB|nr:helix-turn-helix transcriptional regulator [Phaeobacter porticola]APG45628.1 hypothetical protein PhaeoP97_00173 [Phaeobacter porticola]
MPDTDLSSNLRLLCCYGRSVSEVCRRIGINRQQFNKYLTDQTTPSLAKLVRLRPPVLAQSDDPFSEQMERVIRRECRNPGLLERHEGYYHIYMSPDPSKHYLLNNIGRIFGSGKDWFSKELERYEDNEFAIPSTLKHSGLVFEAHNRIFITSREQLQRCGAYDSDHFKAPEFVRNSIFSTKNTHTATLTAAF